MMGLTDILRSRAASQGRTAAVSCGELGRLTVEALPVREIELLLRETDGPRKLFYAACRELQRAGEELRKTGRVYQPDGILQYVSDEEAAAAAGAVLELSGWTGTGGNSPARTENGPGTGFANLRGDNSDGIRLSTVQNTGKDFSEIRPTTVQTEEVGEKQGAETAQTRLASVQFSGESLPGNGQDSHESQEEKQGRHKVFESDGKPQGMEQFSPGETQNVVSEFFWDGSEALNPSGGRGALHEIESEFAAAFPTNPHETESEFRRRTGSKLHEIESGFEGNLHETESDFTGMMRRDLHESKSGFRDFMHETESDFRGSLHESTSDSGENLHEIRSELRKILHETESELGECLARQLLEGLRRAKWVRGG